MKTTHIHRFRHYFYCDGPILTTFALTKQQFMTHQERDILQRLDPEGTKYSSCTLEIVEPQFRSFTLRDKTGQGNDLIALLDDDGKLMPRPCNENDSAFSLRLLDNECNQLSEAYHSLGYEHIGEDEPLFVCAIPDAQVFYYYDPAVPSPLSDGHFVTMSLNIERTCHPTTEAELKKVANHFRKLQAKAQTLAEGLDDAPQVRLFHVSDDVYFSLTTTEFGELEHLLIGFNERDNAILVHRAQIDESIYIDQTDHLENHLLFAIYRLTR